MPGPNATSSYLPQPEGLIGQYGQVHTETLSDDITLDNTYPVCVKLDPGGSGRTVTLPAAASHEGLRLEIVNGADADEDLTVSDGSTVGTVGQNQRGVFYCDGSDWSLVYLATIALS